MSAQICRMYRLIGDNEAAGQSDSLLVTVGLVSPVLALVFSITDVTSVDTDPVSDTLYLPVLTRVLQTRGLVLASVTVLVSIAPPPRVHTAQVGTLEISWSTPRVSAVWTF